MFVSTQTTTVDPPSGSMANPVPNLPTTGDTVWTMPDEKGLIEYLIDHVAEGGDGKKFKMTVFNRAAMAIEVIRTEGGPKTPKLCLGKYDQVRLLVFIHFTTV